MAGRTIAIGDVHGCSVALAAVLRAIDPQPEDVIVPLGDYVDRGPDSKGVLDQFLAWSARCTLIPLAGNHEEMLLDNLEHPHEPDAWLMYGGQATLDSYGPGARLLDIRPSMSIFCGIAAIITRRPRTYSCTPITPLTRSCATSMSIRFVGCR